MESFDAMMMKEQNELILKAIKWTVASAEAVALAGGLPHLISRIPDDVLLTMVRNDIILKHDRKALTDV